MTISQQKIFLGQTVGVCTEMEAALTGHKKGFEADVQKIGPHVKFTHHIIHTEVLT
jgi:hypothetical protein